MREEIKLNCCFACEINHCQNSIGIIQNIILCFSSPLSFLARVKTFFSSSIPSCVLKQQWVCVCVCVCVSVCVCAQLCPTLFDSMDCSPSDSSPWDSPGKNTGLGCHFLLQGIFLMQGSNPCLLHLLHWEENSLPLSYLGSTTLKYKGRHLMVEKVLRIKPWGYKTEQNIAKETYK